MADKTTFSCGEALDIVHAAALKQRLEKSLEKSFHIELKAQDVLKVDTAGLQLFMALNDEVRGHGGELSWKKPSESLLNTARLLGMDSDLGLTGS